MTDQFGTQGDARHASNSQGQGQPGPSDRPSPGGGQGQGGQGQSQPYGAYSGPPPTGYAQDPYAAAPLVPAYGYPPPYGVPPGYAAYPPPGYAMAYAPTPPADRRPGMLTAAAVLAYIEAGLLVLAGLVLFSGSEIVRDLNGSHSGELALDGTLNLIAAGLLIAGAIMVTSQVALGRILYSVGSAIVLALTVYWQARWNDDISYAGIIFYGGLFATLMIVGTSLLWAPDGTRWLNRKRANVTAT